MKSVLEVVIDMDYSRRHNIASYGADLRTSASCSIGYGDSC
jgi:hypothetical protein